MDDRRLMYFKDPLVRQRGLGCAQGTVCSKAQAAAGQNALGFCAAGSGLLLVEAPWGCGAFGLSCCTLCSTLHSPVPMATFLWDIKCGPLLNCSHLSCLLQNGRSVGSQIFVGAHVFVLSEALL